MPYINIQSFKFGLDSRKSELTSQPGTLVTLENAYVNQGGEAAKRFRFARYYSADLATTMGMKFVSSGAVVFGSAATPATLTAWPTFTAVPFGDFAVSYMRLQHPDGATAMTSIVSVDEYGDIPWVIAQFADGKRFSYYNGALVTDFIDGILTTAEAADLSVLATDYAAVINRSQNFTAAVTGDANCPGVVISGPLALPFSSVTTPVSTAGTIVELENHTGRDGSVFQAPIATFRVLAGSPYTGSYSNKITSIKYLLSGTGITPTIGVYSGLTVTALYYWTQGASGTLTNGSQVLGASGLFAATNATATASNTASPGSLVPITATELVPNASDINLLFTFDVNTYASRLAFAINKQNHATGFSAIATDNQVAVYSPSSNSANLRIVSQGQVILGDYQVTVSGSAFVVNNLKVGIVGSETNILGASYTYPTGTKAITNMVRMDNAVIVSCVGHGYISGDVLKVTAATNPSFNGTFRVVASLSANSFEMVDEKNTNSDATYASTATAQIYFESLIVKDINLGSSAYNAFFDGTYFYLALRIISSLDNATNFHVVWTPATPGTITITPAGAAVFSVVQNPLQTKILYKATSSINIGGIATVVASGGAPPYTYKWKLISGNGNITPTLPNSASTQFQCYYNQGGTAVYSCVVTDTTGSVIGPIAPGVTVTHGVGF